MLYNVPDFLRVYGQNSAKILEEIAPVKTYEDFNCQLAKVVGALIANILRNIFAIYSRKLTKMFVVM